MKRWSLVAFACFVTVAIAQEKPAGEQGSLLGGRIVYEPPPADTWPRAHNINGPSQAAYVDKGEKGAAAIEVLPSNAAEPAQMGPAIVRELRKRRQAADQKVLMQPTIERDPHFDLRVHEKYMQGDKTADVLHLYRQVGPRVVMVTVSALVEDEQAARPIHKIGEDLLRSAKWIKPKR